MTPKQLWIEALRSGKYTKSIGALLRPDGTCCALGVACLVYEENVEPLNKTLIDGRYFIAGLDNVLPDKVQEWLGCDAGCNLVSKEPVYRLNDTKELTFLEIANSLENSEFA